MNSLFLKIYLIIVKYTVAVFRHQKRSSDLITDDCEPPCGCWDLNSGPSEEQSVLLTTEPSLQPRILYVNMNWQGGRAEMQARSGLLDCIIGNHDSLKKAVQTTLGTRGVILSTLLPHGNQSP